MKTISSFVVLLLIAISCLAQNDSRLENYYMDFSGKKTYFECKSISWSDYSFTIEDGSKKPTTVKAADVQRLKYGKIIFMNLKGEFGRKNLISIIAYSDKYMLGYEFSGQKALYVYDRDGNVLEKRMLVNNTRYFKKALNKIKPYFSECTDFIKNFEDFITLYDDSSNLRLFNYISMFQCGTNPLFKN